MALLGYWEAIKQLITTLGLQVDQLRMAHHLSYALKILVSQMSFYDSQVAFVIITINQEDFLHSRLLTEFKFHSYLGGI